MQHWRSMGRRTFSAAVGIAGALVAAQLTVSAGVGAGAAALAAAPIPTAAKADLGKTTISGWNTRDKTVSGGRMIRDRIAVKTDGRRLPRQVEVLRRERGTSLWQIAGQTRTNDRGRLTVTFETPAEGVWWFRVRVPADAKGRQAKSAKRKITIEYPEPEGIALRKANRAPRPPAGTAGTTVAVTADIGDCGDDQFKTAQLINWIDGPLIIPGDLAYPSGTPQEFAECYDPFYGPFKPRTYPVPGNHEYNTAAFGYFDYFGTRVGSAETPWYSVDIGSWRFYMLNSNCEEVGCEADGEQHQWLAAQLAQPQPKCTAAVWHHPRWTSARNGPHEEMADLFQLLYDAGGDLVLSGHQHQYERFVPLSPSGAEDPAGVRQFVVGTGGQRLRNFGAEVTPGSVIRTNDSPGVLRMELGPAGYRWAFLPTEPLGTTDSGWDLCH